MRFKLGNPIRGYVHFVASSPYLAWKRGTALFNKQFPTAIGRAVVLFKLSLYASRANLTASLIARIIREYHPIVVGLSTWQWGDVKQVFNN